MSDLSLPLKQSWEFLVTDVLSYSCPPVCLPCLCFCVLYFSVLLGPAVHFMWGSVGGHSLFPEPFFSISNKQGTPRGGLPRGPIRGFAQFHTSSLLYLGFCLSSWTNEIAGFGGVGWGLHLGQDKSVVPSRHAACRGGSGMCLEFRQV